MLIVSTSFEHEIIDKKCNRIFFIDITIKREKRKEKRRRRKKRKKEQAYLTFDGSAKGVQALCEHIVKQTAQREYLTRGQGQVCKGEKIQTNNNNNNKKTKQKKQTKNLFTTTRALSITAHSMHSGMYTCTPTKQTTQ